MIPNRAWCLQAAEFGTYFVFSKVGFCINPSREHILVRNYETQIWIMNPKCEVLNEEITLRNF